MTDRTPDHRRSASVFRAADGSLVVELDVSNGGQVAQLIADAREVGADAVWIEGPTVDPGQGFRRTGGHVTLRAVVPPPALGLPTLPRRAVRDVQRACFAGIWGRREPGAVDPAASFVGLHDGRQWVGICEVRVEERTIGCPGVLPMLRSPERSAELVRGAAALLPPDEPVTLETSGESDETIAAYRELGFEIVTSVPGWELRLRR